MGTGTESGAPVDTLLPLKTLARGKDKPTVPDSLGKEDSAESLGGVLQRREASPGQADGGVVKLLPDTFLGDAEACPT